MYREVQFRCVVQRNNATKDKYYPKIVAFTTYDAVGESPSATIEIITNMTSSVTGYISPIRAGDIIRLQAAERYDTDTYFIYTDLFEGTIESLESQDGTKNTSVLNCKGHINEMAYTIIEEDKKYTSITDATTIISYFVGKYKFRLVYNSLYARTGVSFPEYSTTAYQTFLSDVFSEAEKCSGCKYFIDVVPVYDDDFNLSKVYLTWQPFPTTPTEAYKIIRGTARYISSNFKMSIEELLTYYRVYGDTPQGTTPDVHVNAPLTATASTSGNCSITSTGTLSIPSGVLGANISIGAVPFNGTIYVTGSRNISLSGSDTVNSSGSVSGHAIQTIAGGSVIASAQYVGVAYDSTYEAQFGKRSGCDSTLR